MDDVPVLIMRSAEIVKKWGKTKLSNGKTLSEQLTFNGISLWEVAAPDMALYQVPKALSNQVNYTSLLSHFRPRVSLAKRTVLNFIKYSRNNPKITATAESGHVLFFGFNSYMYRDVLSSVATRMWMDEGKKSLVLHDGYANNEQSHDNGIIFRSIWEYFDSNLRLESRNLQTQMLQVVKELTDKNFLPEMINSENDMPWFQIENAFNWLFQFHLPLLIPQVVIAKYILTHNPPSILISSDGADLRMRIYGLIAHQLNIPVLEVQFGPGGDESAEWQFLVADHIASWGNISREVLINQGVGTEKITITGSPRHDALLHVNAEEIEKTRKRLRVPSGYKMVLCASTHQLKDYNSLSDPELLVTMKRAVFQAARDVDCIFLVVKPHPLEDTKETEKLIGESQNIVFLSVKEDIRELIKACDAYVGFGSTATVDALIANKLTICPIFKGWVWSDPFEKSKATMIVRSEDELVKCFQKIVNGSGIELLADLRSARETYLHELIYKVDGRSTERVVEIAMKIIEKKSTIMPESI